MSDIWCLLYDMFRDWETPWPLDIAPGAVLYGSSLSECISPPTRFSNLHCSMRIRIGLMWIGPRKTPLLQKEARKKRRPRKKDCYQVGWCPRLTSGASSKPKRCIHVEDSRIPGDSPIYLNIVLNLLAWRFVLTREPLSLPRVFGLVF